MSTAVLDQSIMQLSAPPAPPHFEPTGQAALAEYMDAISSPSHSPAFEFTTTASISSFSSSSPSAPALPPAVSTEAVIDLTAEADDVGEDEKEEWRQRKRRKKTILIEESEEEEAEDDDDEEDEENEQEEDEEDEEDAERQQQVQWQSEQKQFDEAVSSGRHLQHRSEELLRHSNDNQPEQPSGNQHSEELTRMLREMEEMDAGMEEVRYSQVQSGNMDTAPLHEMRRQPYVLPPPPSDPSSYSMPVTEPYTALASSASAASSSSSSSAPSSAVLDRLFATAHPHQMQSLLNMGYQKGQAAAALRLAEGDAYGALRWLPPAISTSPFNVSSSTSSTAPAAASPHSAPPTAPSASPVSSSLSAAQLNRLRSASSHSAVSMPIAAVPPSAPRFIFQSPPQSVHLHHPQSPNSAPSYFPQVQPFPFYGQQHRHAAPGPFAPPASSFVQGPQIMSPSPQPHSVSASPAFPPAPIPVQRYLPPSNPVHVGVGRRGRFAAPPASPSPSSSHSSSAFFPQFGSDMNDRAGEIERRQHLLDTLMSYGMAAAHSSASSASSSSHSHHRCSRHSHAHPHYPYTHLSHPSAASPPAAPVDPHDPTGLAAACDTSTLPKELPAALTSLLTYIRTLTPSLAPTHHARLQSITYHLQSLVSAASASASTTAAATSSAVTQEEDTPGDGEGEALCPVCWDRAPDAVLLPCRHISCCERCAGDMKERQLQCPRCNEPIRHVLVVRH